MPSAIDANAVVEWPGLYVNGAAAGCMALPALGWWMAPPLASRVRALLAEAPNSYHDVRWIAIRGDAAFDALLGGLGLLNRLRAAGEIEFVDNRVICSPPTLLAQWPRALDRVLAAVPGPEPVAYRTIVNNVGNERSVTSIETILQRLVDTGHLTAMLPQEMPEWWACSFTRAPEPRGAA
jgi:hypothetical protein